MNRRQRNLDIKREIEMYLVAVFLLCVCVYDLIRPFVLINKQRKELGKSWLDLMKYEAFKSYAFSIFVNVVAIIFFINFLL